MTWLVGRDLVPISVILNLFQDLLQIGVIDFSKLNQNQIYENFEDYFLHFFSDIFF